MSRDPSRFRAFMAELKRRKVYSVAVGYAAAAFVVWQAAEIALPVLGFPETVLRFVVVASILGFPVAVVLAWVYELRPDPAGAAPSAPFRVGAWPIVAMGTVVAAVAVAAFLTMRPNSPEAAAEFRVAVFPLGTVASGGGSLGEGLADLIAVGLDGTPGFTVVDPQALWPPLLRAGVLGGDGAPEGRFAEASRRFSASHFVTGTVLRSGEALQVALRIHDVRSGEPVVSVRASAPVDSLGPLVDQVTVDIVAALWRGDEIPAVGRVDQHATRSPQALSAYLEAMALVRRGRFEDAGEAIERAVAEDSTFALAHLQHARIRSWVLSLNAQAFVGIREIVDRAMTYRDRLTPRNRLRVEALRAIDDTDAVEAAGLLERILQIDAADADAWATLAALESRYAWMIRKPYADVLTTVERALALDSLNVPILYLLGLQQLHRRDLPGAARAAQRMEQVDDRSLLTRGFAAGLDLVAASEARVDSVLVSLSAQEPAVLIAAIRISRMHGPERAERLAAFLREADAGTTNRQLGVGAGLQLAVARGDLQEVATGVRDPALQPLLRLRLRRYLVATALVDTGDPDLAEEAAQSLAEWAPPDSLAWAIDRRDEAWAAGWAAGAYHAALGDTAIAQAYRLAFEALPTGGNPPEWAQAVASDLEARLAARRGELADALEAATRAYDLWSIHDPDEGGWNPEPAIRFHLARRLEASGRAEEATWYLRSFVEPHWVSFYTSLARERLEIDPSRPW